MVLTNLLIALMTTEYDDFAEHADQEVNYMWTETVYDLSHRDRLLPPPFNLLAYAIGIVIHVVIVSPLAIIFPTTSLNLYNHSLVYSFK